MTDAVNQRLHHDHIAADSPTVAAARGHRVAVGDLILTRRNDPTIEMRNIKNPAAELNPVRNGKRWRITHINIDRNALAARRLDDNTLAVFHHDYLSEHITLGYATTIHSAQGVTADTAHAVLSGTATRSLLYVAMTRGRDTNAAYLYERTVEREYGQQPAERTRVPQRGTGSQASGLVRTVVANHDDQPTTAHEFAARSMGESLLKRFRSLVDRRYSVIRSRRAQFEAWQAQTRSHERLMEPARQRVTSLSRSRDHGLSL